MYKLRELEREDIKRINKWRNDPELIACLGAPYRFINEDVDSDWYDKYINARNSCVRCAIIDTEKDEILGLISLININYINRCADLHIMIGGKENRGKGIGTFAVSAMVKHAFLNLNLRRIELGVLENNIVAIRLYERCGFVREGIKRESNYKNGKYENMILMSILKKDFTPGNQIEIE